MYEFQQQQKNATKETKIMILLIDFSMPVYKIQKKQF